MYRDCSVSKKVFHLTYQIGHSWVGITLLQMLSIFFLSFSELSTNSRGVNFPVRISSAICNKVAARRKVLPAVFRQPKRQQQREQTLEWIVFSAFPRKVFKTTVDKWMMLPGAKKRGGNDSDACGDTKNENETPFVFFCPRFKPREIFFQLQQPKSKQKISFFIT